MNKSQSLVSRRRRMTQPLSAMSKSTPKQLQTKRAGSFSKQNPAEVYGVNSKIPQTRHRDKSDKNKVNKVS